MFLRIILLSILGYIVFKTVRNWLLGAPPKSHVKEKEMPKEENIQQKYANKIEDADFEEID